MNKFNFIAAWDQRWPLLNHVLSCWGIPSCHESVNLLTVVEQKTVIVAISICLTFAM